jgi:hypothetical protein
VVRTIVVVAGIACLTLSHAARTREAPGGNGLAFATGWSHDENSGNGYTYFSARTFVDCAHTRIGFRQSADLFTGAYAHDARGNLLSYADLGILLENDDLAPGELGRPNKVQLYGQGSTAGGADLLRFTQRGDAPQRFFNVVCDTPLRMTAWIARADRIDIRYEGTFVAKSGGKPFHGTLHAAIVGFVAADGWSPACTRCAVRRVTTLAVSSGSPTRPGAYFGIRDVRGFRTPTVYWANAVEGAYAGGEPGNVASYALAPFTARARDIVNAPADALTVPRGRPAFIIRQQGEATEYIGLDQR